MLRDFGLFLLVACCLILAILTWNDYKGYAHTVSNWQGVKCDYATNKYVANFYGNKAGYYRTSNLERLNQDIHKGIVVGIDYYALYGVCKGMVPAEILQKHHRDLLRGKVFTYRVILKGNVLEWIEIN